MTPHDGFLLFKPASRLCIQVYARISYNKRAAMAAAPSRPGRAVWSAAAPALEVAELAALAAALVADAAVALAEEARSELADEVPEVDEAPVLEAPVPVDELAEEPEPPTAP